MKKLITPALIAFGLSSFVTQATIVEFQTSHGNFKVNLHDETTPKTVENFLKYVTDGDYDNTIFHRTVDNFVVQGGGARFEGSLPPTWIDVDASFTNEPVYSNTTATISMAKQGGQINSATSQWFINTVNNANSLDAVDSSGGGAYAVFGEVIDGGMDVVNTIAAVQRCNTGYSGFKELPMPDYSTQCSDSNAVPGVENFVTIYQVVIFDSTVKTDADLASVANTLYAAPTAGTPNNESSSGGGSIAWYSLLLTAALVFGRRRRT